MNKKKLLTIIGLLAFCVVVFLPPIIHGYVYPNVGDDTAAHLQVFDRMKGGDPISSRFILSYKLVGYPIIWLSDLTRLSIDTLFLWFNYVALVLIGMTIYFVASRLVNRRAGWLSLIIVLFGAQGVLFQFYFGQIFNAINIGITLPLSLFFVVRYLMQGKVYQLALALALSELFGSFHTSGIYLPFVAGFTTVVYVLYCVFRKQHIKTSAVVVGTSLVVLPAIAFWLFVPVGWETKFNAIHNLGQGMAVPAGNYLMGIVSPIVLVLLAFIVVFFKDTIKWMSSEAKILAIILSCSVVVLAVVAFAKLSLDPFRQALDLATILALLVAVLVGSVVWTKKMQMAMVVVILAVGFGLWHNLPAWLDYNSAISPADKQAIAYVNTLGYYQYNTSAEVAPWIYDRFMTLAKYSKDISGILIVRDKPMTPRSDPKNKWYEGHGIDPDWRYTLSREFNDGKVTVNIYERTIP